MARGATEHRTTSTPSARHSLFATALSTNYVEYGALKRCRLLSLWAAKSCWSTERDRGRELGTEAVRGGAVAAHCQSHPSLRPNPLRSLPRDDESNATTFWPRGASRVKNRCLVKRPGSRVTPVGDGSGWRLCSRRGGHLVRIRHAHHGVCPHATS